MKENFIGTANNFSVEQISRSEAHAKNGMDELSLADIPRFKAVPPRVIAGFLRTMALDDVAEASVVTSRGKSRRDGSETTSNIM